MTSTQRNFKIEDFEDEEHGGDDEKKIKEKNDEVQKEEKINNNIQKHKKSVGFNKKNSKDGLSLKKKR